MLGLWSHTRGHYGLFDGRLPEVKWLLIFPIRLYRRAFPTHRANQCLFRESCCQHVLRITSERGFSPGLAALWRRGRQCRHGYEIVSSPDGRSLDLLLRDGTLLPAEQVSPKVCCPIHDGAAALEFSLNAATGGRR